MTYSVDLSQSARRTYASAPLPLAKKLRRCFETLERDPRRHHNIKALKGVLAGQYRYRVGDWRVIYRIDDATATVYISLIGNRRDVYE
jgi:mRNA interferase RelE/StbE